MWKDQVSHADVQTHWGENIKREDTMGSIRLLTVALIVVASFSFYQPDESYAGDPDILFVDDFDARCIVNRSVDNVGNRSEIAAFRVACDIAAESADPPYSHGFVRPGRESAGICERNNCVAEAACNHSGGDGLFYSCLAVPGTDPHF